MSVLRQCAVSNYAEHRQQRRLASKLATVIIETAATTASLSVQCVCALQYNTSRRSNCARCRCCCCRQWTTNQLLGLDGEQDDAELQLPLLLLAPQHCGIFVCPCSTHTHTAATLMGNNSRSRQVKQPQDNRLIDVNWQKAPLNEALRS